MSVINLEEYLCLDKIGEGQSPVFRVRNRVSGKEYALKRIKRRDLGEHNSDLGEVLRLLSCEHENIVKVLGYDLKVSQEKHQNVYCLYILMQLGEPTLAQEILLRREQNQLFTQWEFFRVLAQLLDVYSYMQEKKQLAHQDVKPQNMLYSRQSCTIQICDFNDCFSPQAIPSTSSAQPHLSSQLVGTPYYMAPELKGHYDKSDKSKLLYDPFKSDVYSLGLSLLDLVELNVQTTQLSLNDRLELVRDYYGDNFHNLMARMLEPEAPKRADFLDTVKSEEYQRVQEEMIQQVQVIENIGNQSSYCHSVYQHCSDVDSFQVTSISQFDNNSELEYNNESLPQDNAEVSQFINHYVSKISNLTEDMIALYNQQVNPPQHPPDPSVYSLSLEAILKNTATLTQELQINQNPSLDRPGLQQQFNSPVSKEVAN